MPYGLMKLKSTQESAPTMRPSSTCHSIYSEKCLDHLQLVCIIIPGHSLKPCSSHFRTLRKPLPPRSSIQFTKNWSWHLTACQPECSQKHVAQAGQRTCRDRSLCSVPTNTSSKSKSFSHTIITAGCMWSRCHQVSMLFMCNSLVRDQSKDWKTSH